ncbi:MAG: hypothetical protein KAW40_05820 [Candidatus Aenigmarchaeota archaeon]|nr:hypothetical protein [Candidatus Aenigmarchaeota archaeon]
MGLKEFFWPTKMHIAVFIILLFLTVLAWQGSIIGFEPPDPNIYQIYQIIALIVAAPMVLINELPYTSLLIILIPLYWYIVASIIAYLINFSRGRTEKTASNI